MAPKKDIVHCEYAKRGVWLMKVPRYLSDLWEANAGTDVGRLVISSGGRQVRFVSKPDLQPTQSTSELKPPEEFNVVLRDIPVQKMAVLEEDKSGLNDELNMRSGRLAIQGRVVKRAECQPVGNKEYMRMKIAHFQKSVQPKKFVKQLDQAVSNFKPVSIHSEDLARMKQKKEGAKTVRGDRDMVRESLFHAFEKHQYYRLQDLQQLTQQPAGYVKEILQEIAVYNAAPPHKSMWELKPEYRSYGHPGS
ncbi:unnamed protein product [Auanema sp. JU1783]|nr:unnamed protein product [Auanema sp. JU1783]